LTQVGKDFDGKTWKGSGMLKKATGNPEFSWLEKYPGGRMCKVAATYASSGQVDISVTGNSTSIAYILTPGDTVMNFRTGERMLVSSIQSATTFRVVANGRAFGSSPAVAGAAEDTLLITGNVNEENSAPRALNATRTEKETNYTQIFRTTYGVSNTEEASDLYGGKDLETQCREMGVQHGLDIERAFWLGEKKIVTDTTLSTQGKPMRQTGGILEFLSAGNSYVQNQDGPLTAPDMELFLGEGSAFQSSEERYLFAGSKVLRSINEIARGQLVTKMEDKSYGVSIQQWRSSFGTINIVTNPAVFVGDFAGYGFLLDMSCFAYRYMNTRDTHINTNIQPNGLDGRVDEFFTECGLERSMAPKCALLKGVEA
jgi:hypothetical protein